MKTNDMWAAVIGGSDSGGRSATNGLTSEQATNVMLLAKASSAANAGSSDVIRGGCKRCGLLGHLSFQCRNVPQVQKRQSDSDSDSSDSSSDDEGPSRLVPPLSAKEKAPPVPDKIKRKREDDGKEERRERRRLKKDTKKAKKREKKEEKKKKREVQKRDKKKARTENK